MYNATTLNDFSKPIVGLRPGSDIFSDAQDVFEVDSLTGFMAHRPPPARLPVEWEVWEVTLDEAVRVKIQLGNKSGLTSEEKTRAEVWRASVQRIPVLSIVNLTRSKPLLRRAHLVLTFIQHFYLHSLPPTEEPIIPKSIALPLLRVSALLKIPPLLTYSDTVLYNYRIDPEYSFPFCSSSSVLLPSPGITTSPKHDLSHIRSQTTFTSTTDEEEFYLCSARIELRGVEALELMRIIMDEMFIGDDIAVRRVGEYLSKLAVVIDEMKALLETVKTRCDPDRYYNDLRPWFNGEDIDARGRKWVFEGIDEIDDPEIKEPKELSGPSAGQSSIVHVLDVFLGVDHESVDPGKPSFMTRMKRYMPYQHQLFIDHLASYPRPLRAFVTAHGEEEEDGDGREGELRMAYNKVVKALKEFRDAHMIVAALYILGPARRARDRVRLVAASDEKVGEPVKGTGGTELVTFLKDTRTRTMNAILPE
ncbi:hypothetical protein AX15_000554 [Amanita polypyramis BW_CC]|nr:hypothetical protein AX15_000554 [Amanita polypyramis BW_CC]